MIYRYDYPIDTTPLRCDKANRKGRLFGIELEIELTDVPDREPHYRECTCEPEYAECSCEHGYIDGRFDILTESGECECGCMDEPLERDCTCGADEPDYEDDPDDYHLQDQSRAIDRAANGKAICKSDGSLSYGLEIVTRPGVISAHAALWPKILESLESDARSHDTGTCGLHVHVDRKGISQLTIGKILVFINSEHTRKLIKKIARRSSNHYSEIIEKKLTDGRRCDPNRYQAVNLQNAATIEFRIFKGTLAFKSIMACIEFCDSVVSFCESYELSVSAWSAEYGILPAYEKYIVKQAQWNYLTEYFTTRNYPLNGVTSHVSIDR